MPVAPPSPSARETRGYGGLAPSVVASLTDLELVARLIVEGVRSGPHRSPFRGFSTEFDQHRSYRPGDDLRHLDWKLLGKTDRLYTRQFRDTTNMAVMLVVDASASMGFPDTGVSKLRYGTIVAAALAYLIVTQGDSVGLMCTAGEALTYLPARGGRAHLRRLLATLERLHAAGAWRPARAIARAGDLLKRRGLIIAISDFYDDEDDTLRELKRAGRRGHDVAMIQTLSAPELSLPYTGDLEFRDLESGALRTVSAAGAGREYRASVGTFLEGWRSRARQNGIDYALLTTDDAPERALRTYVVKRGSRLRPGRHASSAAR